MNNKSFFAFLVTILLLIVLSLSTLAQDATGTPSGTDAGGEATEEAGDMGHISAIGVVNCDSDLILSLYIAERFFGFSSFNNQMSSDTMIDMNRINRGQFTTLFDQIDPSASVITISEESRSTMSGLLAMNDTDFTGQMNTAMSGTSATTLSTAAFADDSPECAALRASLRRFYMAVAMSDSQMGGFGANSSDFDTNGEATEEAGD